MRMEIITRSKLSVKYKVIATSVDNLEMDADKATSSNKKRKYRNLNTDERIERQETEYVGVYWDKLKQRWRAQIQIGKKRKPLGYFDNDYDAAMRYDEEARKHRKAVNFKFSDEEVQSVKQKKPRKLICMERIERQETEYVGVSWSRQKQQWKAQVKIGKKQKYLGSFDSDYDAAMKYDEEARKHGKPVNVPIYHADIQAKKPKKPRKLSDIERIERQETEYVGVYWDKLKQRWRAYISIARKNKTRGYFESDYDAAMKYDEEARKHGKPVNVPIHPSDVQAEKQKKTRKLSDIERIESQETDYKGVSWDKGNQRWQARIQIGKKEKRLGYFDSDYDAAIKYDEEARKQGKAVNFKFSEEEVQAERRKKPRNLSGMERIERQETEYVGVCWDKKSQRWRTQIQIGKKQKYLGSFDSDYEAAKRYDEQARKQGKPVNVPIHPADIQAEKQNKG